MARGLRFIILNEDKPFGVELRAILMSFEGAKIVAEVDNGELLSQTMNRIQADVLLVNLDPQPDKVLPLAGSVAADHPEVAVFAVSESADGSLILDAMRKGLKEFLTKPIDPDTLSEALEKVAEGLEDAPPRGKLITVLGGSGGVGATTLATNVAVELADLSSAKIALVDLDLRFGQVATFLDLDATYTLADLCTSVEQTDQQMVERALIEHSSGVRVLSRPATFAQADSITAAECVGVLSVLTSFNDYVVVDGPIRFEPLAQAVLGLADINLLVVQLLVPSVRNTVRILEGMREGGFNMERARLVCNRVGKESSHLSVDDVVATIGIQTHNTIPDDWDCVGGAINLGVPMMDYSPKIKVRLAVRNLAEQLHDPDKAADESISNKKGLMSRIFAEK